MLPADNIPRNYWVFQEEKENKIKIKAKIHMKEFGSDFPVAWSVVNGAWFHWPCKFINTRFPYSGRFLRSIHIRMHPWLCSLSLRQLSQRILSKLFSWWVQFREERNITAEHHSGGVKVPLNWLPHFMGGRIWEVISVQIRGQEGEIISEENWKSAIVKMSLASCLWYGKCTAFLP